MAEAAGAGYHRRSWRIVAITHLGDRYSQRRPAIAEMLINGNSSSPTSSQTAHKDLVRKIYAPVLPTRRHGVQVGAAAINAIESGGEIDDWGEAKSQNGGFESRPATARCSALASQMAVNLNLSRSTCAENAVDRLRGEKPVDPIQFPWGGMAVIKANRSGGDKESDGGNETTHKAGYNRSSVGYVGRRAAMALGASSLWTSLGCCRHCEEAVAAPDWNYAGPCGSAEWEGLCANGTRQSPIDITSSRTKGGASLGVLDFVYVPSAPSVLNTGHGTIQVSFASASNVLRVKGQTLQLLQFHFHAPSEHTFNGEHYAMEAHLVHRDPVTRKLAVVGVMLDASNYALPNKCLAASLAYVPQEHGQSMDAPIHLSPSLLLPPSHGKNGSRGYIHYGGSLTTPPCSEGVEWFVLDTPLKISSSQVLDFLRFSGDGHSMAFNSRPLQPLGDRIVVKGP